MKRFLLILQFTCFGILAAYTQNVAINKDGSQPQASAMLDIQSTDKGLLIPRMTAAQKMNITAPATGLLVYQTDNVQGFYYYDGNAWKAMLPGPLPVHFGGTNSWSLNGNTGTVPGLNMLGTKDSTALWLATSGSLRMLLDNKGHIGVGTPVPAAVFHIENPYSYNQPVLNVKDANTTNTKPALFVKTGSQSNAGYFTSTNPNVDGPVLKAEYTGSDTYHSKPAVEGVNKSSNGTGGRFEGGSDGIDVLGQYGAMIDATYRGIDLTVNADVKEGFSDLYAIRSEITNAGDDGTIGIYSKVTSNAKGNIIGVWSRPVGPADARFKTSFYGEGNINITGNYYHSSDKKLKQNIQPLKGMLDKLMLLNPSSYQYKTTDYKLNLPEGKQMGLIAQDVQSVFPELVQQQVKPIEKNKKGEVVSGELQYLGVNYEGLIPVLISSVQELKKENDILRNELQIIKAKLHKQ